MTSQDLEKVSLPDEPGVYFFKNSEGEILYIGKATSLRSRVKSYFSRDLIETRSPLIAQLVGVAAKVDFEKTDSVLEALILEAALIKKHKPHYNTDLKDNKSFSYVVFTAEPFPKVLSVRGRELEFENTAEYKYVFGPFPHGGQLKEALKIIRRIFPYTDGKCTPAYVQVEKGRMPKPCFNRQIGLCPGVCTGEIDEKDYARQIRHLKLFFEGKKSQLLKELEKEMKRAAKDQKFEEAERIKRTVFALMHIQDVALLKAEKNRPTGEYRIEAYDIAHLSGTNVVGVMVVVEDGEAKKSDYRKFRIRGTHGGRIDDTNNLKEVLVRRLGHAEWPLPNLIVVDGGVGQINAAKEVLSQKGLGTKIVSVVKDERHKPREIMEGDETTNLHKSEIILANSEAHRFAIAYHTNRRGRFLK